MMSCTKKTQVLDKYIFELDNCIIQRNSQNCYQEYINKLKKVYNDQDLQDQIIMCKEELENIYTIPPTPPPPKNEDNTILIVCLSIGIVLILYIVYILYKYITKKKGEKERRGFFASIWNSIKNFFKRIKQNKSKSAIRDYDNIQQQLGEAKKRKDRR